MSILNVTPDQIQLVRESIAGNEDRIFEQLAEVVAFNSVHGEPELREQIEGAAQWVAQAFAEVGIPLETIETADGSIALVGHRPAAEGAPTVLLYSHYDVVPAGDRAAWVSDPFTLTKREGRWYGRGAADCKGNLVMHLAALRALAAAGGSGVGLRVVVEGSEERGGEGLDTLITQRPELFAADAILIADSGNAAVGTPTLSTSLRGGAQLTVTVRTLERAVHSGSFGGAAPDAVFALLRTLDSLRDEHGRTVIDGVDTSQRWTGEPYDADTFRQDAGVLDGVQLMGTVDDAPADFVWARPAVTITGFSSTPVAEAVNAIPAVASARLNLRVPAHMAADQVAEKLVNHLYNHVPWGAHLEASIDDTNPGFATDVTKPAAIQLREALATAYQTQESATIGSGGSIPLTAVLQEAYPDAEIAIFGVEEPLAAIHSPNESVAPSEITGIATAEALFLLGYHR